MNTALKSVPTAIVVGAGLSGLAAARALKAHGMAVEVLDQAQRVGETWRRRHPQLRLNTHRRAIARGRPTGFTPVTRFRIFASGQFHL